MRSGNIHVRQRIQSDVIHSHMAPTRCVNPTLSMCRERSNVLTHFSVCTADISLSYADSNYLRTASPPEGGRTRRRGESEGDNDGATVESETGRDEAVSQHISNEHGDMMCWRRKRAPNRDGCIKYGLPLCFPCNQFHFLSTFYIFYKDKRRNRSRLKYN